MDKDNILKKFGIGFKRELKKLSVDEDGGMSFPEKKEKEWKKPFRPINRFKKKTLCDVFKFAYDMSFGEGYTNPERAGGTEVRTKGQIFKDTFQGKLSEFAFCNALHNKLPYDEPDTSVHGKGIWDNVDAIIKGYAINIKSSKYFSNLLLLETANWNDNGQYIPNLKDSKKRADYDFHVIVRIKPSCEDIVRKQGLLSCEEISIEQKEHLKSVILEEVWEYDFLGWCDNNVLIQAMKEKNILPKGKMFNKKTEMDTNNYYVISIDLYSIDELINLLTLLPEKDG